MAHPDRPGDRENQGRVTLFSRLKKSVICQPAQLLALLGGCKVYNDYMRATRSNEIKCAEDIAYKQWMERIKQQEESASKAKQIAENIHAGVKGRWNQSIISSYDDFKVDNESSENIHDATIKVWHKDKEYTSNSIPIIFANGSYTWESFAEMSREDFDRSTVKWHLSDCQEYRDANEKKKKLNALRKEFEEVKSTFITHPESRN